MNNPIIVKDATKLVFKKNSRLSPGSGITPLRLAVINNNEKIDDAAKITFCKKSFESKSSCLDMRKTAIVLNKFKDCIRADSLKGERNAEITKQNMNIKIDLGNSGITIIFSDNNDFAVTIVRMHNTEI